MAFKAKVDRLTGAESMNRARFRDCSARKIVRGFCYVEENDLRLTPGTKSLARLIAIVNQANTSLSSSYQFIIFGGTARRLYPSIVKNCQCPPNCFLINESMTRLCRFR